MNLTDRLLNPTTVEAELKWVESSGKVGIPCEEVATTYPRAIAEMADAIRELHRRLAAAREEIARLKEDSADMDYLESEPEIELDWQKRWNGDDKTPPYPDVLYLRNLPITRSAVRAARAGGAR